MFDLKEVPKAFIDTVRQIIEWHNDGCRDDGCRDDSDDTRVSMVLALLEKAGFEIYKDLKIFKGESLMERFTHSSFSEEDRARIRKEVIAVVISPDKIQMFIVRDARKTKCFAYNKHCLINIYTDGVKWIFYSWQNRCGIYFTLCDLNINGSIQKEKADEFYPFLYKKYAGTKELQEYFYSNFLGSTSDNKVFIAFPIDKNDRLLGQYFSLEEEVRQLKGEKSELLIKEEDLTKELGKLKEELEAWKRKEAALAEREQSITQRETVLNKSVEDLLFVEEILNKEEEKQNKEAARLEAERVAQSQKEEELEKKISESVRRERKVERKQAELRTAETQLKNREELLEEKYLKLSEREATLDERERTMTEKGQATGQKDKELIAAETALAKRIEETSKTEALLVEKMRALEERERALQEKEKQLKEKSQEKPEEKQEKPAESKERTLPAVFSISHSGGKAYVEFVHEKRWVLQAGSFLLSEKASSKVNARQRKWYSAVIRKEGQRVVTEKQIVFSCPSKAAEFVIGGQRNGWNLWKDKEGRPASDYK